MYQHSASKAILAINAFTVFAPISLVTKLPVTNAYENSDVMGTLMPSQPKPKVPNVVFN